jgi:MinD-like ATPase involved in chromosome partitioning or flagellar assembly
VVSPKGGVGKTFITALLGSLLAFLRRDRVIAVDANPDFGSLGRRLVPDHPVFIDDLLAGPLQHETLSITHLDAQLGRGPNGLMVAPAPTDPTRAALLDEAAYRTLFTRLSDAAGTLVLDCGTGLEAPPARAALACADQLVLVTDAEPDTASLVWEAAQRLQDGPPLVLVVNKLDRSSRLDVAALERTIPFARGLVQVPHDRAGADQLLASRFSWSQPPAPWRRAAARARRATRHRLVPPRSHTVSAAPAHDDDKCRARQRARVAAIHAPAASSAPAHETLPLAGMSLREGGVLETEQLSSPGENWTTYAG